MAIQAAYSNIPPFPRSPNASNISIQNLIEDAMGPNMLENSVMVETVMSISSLAVKTLQAAHNAVAAEDAGALKWLKIVGIEIGFLATTVLLAPLESLIRLVVGAVLVLIAYIGSWCGMEQELLRNLYSIGVIGFALTSLQLANGAVSLYTNIAHHNNQIDYAGQVRHHILRQEPA